MCSRYFLDADGNVIAYTFRVAPDARIRQRFNIAPTQEAPVIRARKDGAREMALLRWGLVPFWAKDLKVGTRMINARSEEAESKPAFREAMRARRCAIPATGFYEWRGEPGRKQPFAITLPGTKLFAFAGLWERWRPPGSGSDGEPKAAGDPIETFTIMTTEANGQVAAVHDRMPVLLAPEAVDTWISAPLEEARRLLTPYAGPVAIRAVGRYVSNVNNEGPECLEDAPPAAQPRPSSGQGQLF